MSSFFQHSNPAAHKKGYIFVFSASLNFQHSDRESLELIEKRTEPPRALLTLTKRQLSEGNIGQVSGFRSYIIYLRLLSVESDSLETVKYYSCCLSTFASFLPL